MAGIRTNLRVMFAFVVAYLLNKFLLRPWVIESDITGLLKTFTFSFPNFCEGVVGTILLANIALAANAHFLNESRKWKEVSIYFTVTLLAGVYVILQEFKVHNLGGRNVYDFNDVVFSIIGLAFALGYLLIMKPKYVAE